MLADLPLDLKLAIVHSLDSLDDVTSLVQTCREFYSICKDQPLWTSIQLSRVQHDLGEPLQALLRIKAFKDGKTHEQASSIYPDPNDLKKILTGTKEENLSLLLYYRNTVRWFSNQLFKRQFQKFAEEQLGQSTTRPALAEHVKPTVSELLRADLAFLTLWVLAETNFETILREDRHVDELEQFVLVDFPPLYVDLASLYTVYKFTIESMATSTKRYGDEKSDDEKVMLSQYVNCLTTYHRSGVPNIILQFHGLDGVKAFLKSPWEKQRSINEKNYNYLHEHWDDMGYVIYLGSRDLEVNFDDMWESASYKRWELESARIPHRPLWRTRDGENVYKIQAPVWIQNEGFDFEAAIWDDERLEGWGYVRSRRLDESKPQGLTSLRDQLTEKFVCQECPEPWGCAAEPKIEIDCPFLD